MNKPWSSGFNKKPVREEIWLGKTNLAGDQQADTKNHGGPDKAILVYSADHYQTWSAELFRERFPFGGFGENFSVTGQNEQTVYIGDIYQIGQAVIQVSQPRIPCWKISKRWNLESLTDRVKETGRTGWYCRVITEGSIQPGMPIMLIRRPHPEWSVSDAWKALFERNKDPQIVQLLASCEALASRYREIILNTD